MKRILFISGTRADFGKLKPLIKAVRGAGFEYQIFATGMHMQALYGMTCIEIQKAGLSYYPFMNNDCSMDAALSNTINGLGRYVREYKPDMIVVHGDRIEALAGATVGALNNILVAHIEGGEVSGTVDELIRHSVSKLAHLHFVANEEAETRLRQMGEENIFIIGSPDIDVMLSNDLPSLEEVKRKYDIPFKEYGIFCYHPVTTEREELAQYFDNIVFGIYNSEKNFVMIYPNNDDGSEIIIDWLRSIECHRMRLIPSMQFEYFLTLLKNATCIVGNSSAGIREAPVYGVPTINIGTRQKGRADLPSIVNVPEHTRAIVNALNNLPKAEPSLYFGAGNSADLFLAKLKDDKIWDTPRQKQFHDIRP